MACLLRGRLKTCPGLFRLIIRFFLTNIIRPDVLQVNCTLRAITSTATFLSLSRPTIFSILPITLGLNVEAGLLSINSLGPTVMVWVTSICRRRLLDSASGH